MVPDSATSGSIREPPLHVLRRIFRLRSKALVDRAEQRAVDAEVDEDAEPDENRSHGDREPGGEADADGQSTQHRSELSR